MKEGLYILKTNRISNYYKYGRTKNIDNRLYFYKKDGYDVTLLHFFPCKYPKMREEFLKTWELDFRITPEQHRFTNSEWVEVEDNEFDEFVSDVKYCATITEEEIMERYGLKTKKQLKKIFKLR